MKLNNEQMSSIRAATKVQPRRSRRQDNLHGPVKQIKLTHREEQRIYDDMYEHEVWKNDKFFGYRSTVASSWHSDRNFRAAPTLPSIVKAIIDERALELWQSNRYKIEPTYKEMKAATLASLKEEEQLKERKALQATYGPVEPSNSTHVWPMWYFEAGDEYKTNVRIKRQA